MESVSKRILKTVNIWGNYGQEFGVLFFDSLCTCICLITQSLFTKSVMVVVVAAVAVECPMSW